MNVCNQLQKLSKCQEFYICIKTKVAYRSSSDPYQIFFTSLILSLPTSTILISYDFFHIIPFDYYDSLVQVSVRRLQKSFTYLH